MGFELERVLYRTEDYLRRNLAFGGSRAARTRRLHHAVSEAARRAKRAGFVLAGLLAALVAVSIVTPVGFLTWLAAIPTALLIALLSMLLPTRSAAPPPVPASAPLDELAARAADGLLDRLDELPRTARPAADAIVARLHELHPHLGALHPDATLTGDARRLIARHLPRLVDSYLALPPGERDLAAEASRRLAESLDIVAAELEHLLDQCCRDRRMGFETESRFIESRYSDARGLGGGEPPSG